MDKYEKAWAGNHGKDYVERCNVDSNSRVDIFDNILSEIMIKDKSVLLSILEVGCNKGHNLDALNTIFNYEASVSGIEIYKKLCTRPDIINGSIYNLPWEENTFDLVFSSGVLIHIPPHKLDAAMYQMRSVASKYVLIIEYYSEKEVGKKYGEDFNFQDGVWHRPYGDIYQNNYKKDQLLLKGKISDIGDDGWAFSNCDYWVFKKSD